MSLDTFTNFLSKVIFYTESWGIDQSEHGED